MNTYPFTDTTGREWHVSLDVAKGLRVKQQLGVDLFHQDVFGAIESPAVCVEVAHLLCSDLCDDRGMDQKAFFSVIDGDVLDAIVIAVWRSVADFFPEAVKKKIHAELNRNLETRAKLVAQLTSSSSVES